MPRPDMTRVLDQVGQPALELPSGKQAGQHVMPGLPGHLTRQCAGFRDIVKHHDHAHRLARLVEDRRGRVLNGDLAAVARHQIGTLAQADIASLAATERDRMRRGLAGRLVHDHHHRLHRHALRLGKCPSGQCFGHGVHEAHVAFQVGGDDRVADGRQGNAGALVLRAQLLLALLQFGDLGVRTQHANGLALLVAQRASAHQDPLPGVLMAAHAQHGLVAR